MSLAGTPPGRALLGPRRPTGALPWMIAATSFLAVLGLAAALALADMAGTLAEAGVGRYTIEIVDADADGQSDTARRLDADLRRLAGVARVDRVPAAEIARLAAPVLGADVVGAVPLPALIDVTLAPGIADAGLRALVRRVPRASLVGAAKGLAPLAALVATLRRLVLALTLLAVAVTVLVAMLAARATLAAHAATLSILHALGATDADVASLVQRRTAGQALVGGGIGFAAAALAVHAVGSRYAALGGLVPGSPALGAGGWLALVLLPLFLAALATLTARLAVIQALGRQP